MWTSTDFGSLLRDFWPQVPAGVAMLFVAFRSRSGRTTASFIAASMLLPLLVLSYWLIHGFGHPGDFAGRLVSCFVFLGSIAAAIYIATKFNAAPAACLAAGLFVGVLTTATLPVTWIYVACYTGGDCI